jgi:choline dehydrogenase-like flavoprotein
MDDIDVVVIGAGVIGLAAARSLALAGREVVVLESAEAIGTGTSSRNSEVFTRVSAAWFFGLAMRCRSGAPLPIHCRAGQLSALRADRRHCAASEAQLHAGRPKRTACTISVVSQAELHSRGLRSTVFWRCDHRRRVSSTAISNAGAAKVMPS